MKIIVEDIEISQGKNYLLLRREGGGTFTSYRKKFNSLVSGNIGNEVKIKETEGGYLVDGNYLKGWSEELSDFIFQKN